MKKLYVHFLSVFISTTYAFSDPENLEINDQFSNTTEMITTHNVEPENQYKKSEEHVSQFTLKPVTIVPNRTRKNMVEVGVINRIYIALISPFKKFFAAPKVNQVMRNIGTCTVNGFMEIISYYMPAPLMPLIAAAAGTLIPFEPVVMLREKMPVTSYRRAFKKAVNSFLGTFDKYKIDDNFEDDPYMTMRFNRRFMNLGKNEVKDVRKKTEESDE